MKKIEIVLSIILALFVYQIAMAQMGGPAGRAGQPAAIAGARSAIEADAEATKIEFRTEDGRTTNNVLTDQRGWIVATVTNKGGIQLAGLKTQIEVDGTIVRQDDLTIGVGRSQDLTLSYAFTTPGSHIIALVVDPRNQVPESNKSNNRVERVINIAARAYDVEATSIECNPTAGGRNVNTIDKGGEADVVGTVTNRGNAPITRVKVRLIVGGSIIREDTVGIDPGMTASITGRYKFDISGAQMITLIADPDNTLQETNKNNNRIQKTIEVKEAKPMALLSNIQLDPQKIRVIPTSTPPNLFALEREMRNIMSSIDLIMQRIRQILPTHHDVMATYINSVRSSCLPKTYSVQDQQSAGCTQTDTVDACMQKLYTWCCNTNNYHTSFERYQREMEAATANANMSAKLQELNNASSQMDQAVRQINQLFTP